MTEIFNRDTEKAKRKKLRRNMPPAEVLLWTRLRAKQIAGLKFRRQYSIGPYIVDFYCPALRLAIELDGESHSDNSKIAYDRQRQDYIEFLGIRFLRFMNIQVYEDMNNVIEYIASTAESLSNDKGH